MGFLLDRSLGTIYSEDNLDVGNAPGALENTGTGEMWRESIRDSMVGSG